MDIFRVLSRGASLKKSKDINSDYTMPTKAQQVSQSKKQLSLSHEVEKELDFFHHKSHKTVEKVHNKEDKQNYEDIDDLNEGDFDENNDEIPQKITTVEDALQLRKANRANVSGHDVSLPIGSFEDLISRFKFSRQLLTNLINNDFTEPTPIQSEAIPAALYDRDLIACAPTGSGKTLAFLIPMLQQLSSTSKNKKFENKGIRGLIIAPTKELAQQIYAELSKLSTNLNVKPAYLNKSIAAKLRNRSINASKFDILVSTPLRLIELVKEEFLDLSYVEQLIFDEADRLFESNFVEQTDRVLSACTNHKLRRSIYSATITSHVEELAQSIMNSPIRIIIGHKEAANSNIHQKLVFCGNEHGKLLAIREMLQNGEFKPPVIIFLQSISRAKALFHELIYDRLNVDVIHAERTPKQREIIIERFKKGELWCLITTDILSRGVDFKGINLIINYDVPNSAQAYVHRIGRTGRGGKEGRAVTFYTKEDVISIKSVVNVMKQSGSLDGLPKWMQSDDALSKLTKQQKKDLKRRQIERKGISTVPSVVRNKRKLQKEMILASKKRKNVDKKDETIIPNE